MVYRLDKESKKILVKFLGVILLVASVILLMRSDKNYVLMGLAVFSIALVILIIYNLKKDSATTKKK
ncbi:hypothetical protein J4218_00235 [Candidatus Pacearchaeota archaeon]|nr:hypothetical protein [Candidatus Pacearchaeota archaeon]